MKKHDFRRRLTFAGTLLALLLAGCGSDDDTTAQAPSVGDLGQPAGGAETPGTPTGATGLPDGSTSGSAPQGQSFVGLFEGDGVSLNLDVSGDGLRGSLFFRGKSYYVTARDVNGALSGEFQSGGKTYAISAVHEALAVILTSSNKTYTLQRKLRPNLLAKWASAGSPSAVIAFEGEFLGEFHGASVTLQLHEADEHIDGALTTSDHTYTLVAKRGVMNATGTLRDAAASAVYDVEISATAQGKLRLAISPQGSARGTHLVIAFNKAGS